MVDLAFVTGVISYDELSLLRGDDLVNQVGVLKEDMLQVLYSSSILLDVGWYPSFDASGGFQIRAIKDCDWESPIFFTKAATIALLLKELIAAQNKINRFF
ncbi:hypothetical protein [Pseudomonas sp. NFX15]|uniref:hypothetical protein n=1 Tax=Pseudomonas sp. NFX15 TaxID=2816958 RepID=UPI003B8C0585